jgi:hypothetical protein
MRLMSRARNDASSRREPARPAPMGRKDRVGEDAFASSHIEALLDEALAETFPASDPVALLWRGGTKLKRT